MSAAPCPEPEEPDGSWVPGAPAGGDGDEEGLQQGLYVTLPAEEMTLEGFTQDGRTDTMAPGPLLETVLEAVAGPDGTGLAQLSDDQLLGFMSGVRRVESRMAWARMASMAEFASRPRRKDFATDEIADAFGWTWYSTAGQVSYASTVARRLPKLFALLAAGKIDALQLKIIEEETSILSDADAARADAELAQAAQSMTYGKLRSFAGKLVLKLDPEAVRKRKEAGKREASVRHFREDSGNAGITGREMPAVEVLASMQHVEDRARQLRAAGVPGTWEQLKVRATLDLLQERDSRQDPGTQAGAGSGTGPDDAGSDGGPGPDDGTAGLDGGMGPEDSMGPDDSDPGDSGPDDGAADPDGDGPGDGDGDGGPGDDGGGGSGPGGGPGGSGPAPASGPAGTGPTLAALVTITVPWALWHGGSGAPADVDGFGILDPDDTRDAVAAAARSPDSRWCVTVLNPDGTAAAHGCAAGPRHWPTGPPGPRTPRDLLEKLKITSLGTVIRGPCDHRQAEDRYRPSRRLQHLIKARNATCTAPGCNCPASKCDLDHTDPHHQGGKTCGCNLAPLCRHHHRCKQADGWSLEQPEPGVLRWHTPAGRTYTVTPSQYTI